MGYQSSRTKPHEATLIALFTPSTAMRSLDDSANDQSSVRHRLSEAQTLPMAGEYLSAVRRNMHVLGPTSTIRGMASLGTGEGSDRMSLFKTGKLPFHLCVEVRGVPRSTSQLLTAQGSHLSTWPLPNAKARQRHGEARESARQGWCDLTAH